MIFTCFEEETFITPEYWARITRVQLVYGKPATVNSTKIAFHLTMNAVLFQFIEPKKSSWPARRNNMQMEKEKVGEPGIFGKL